MAVRDLLVASDGPRLLSGRRHRPSRRLLVRGGQLRAEATGELRELRAGHQHNLGRGLDGLLQQVFRSSAFCRRLAVGAARASLPQSCELQIQSPQCLFLQQLDRRGVGRLPLQLLCSQGSHLHTAKAPQLRLHLPELSAQPRLHRRRLAARGVDADDTAAQEGCREAGLELRADAGQDAAQAIGSRGGARRLRPSVAATPAIRARCRSLLAAPALDRHAESRAQHPRQVANLGAQTAHLAVQAPSQGVELGAHRG
mmetsp:Transcript_54868/g.177583  ORF Transcript_54868/g.177583 Transcript_54868/m.177583 type:complete len:256 (-) Transcript_54868:1275-2042(-)